MPTVTTSLSHKERKERRRKVARAVKGGATLAEVANEFGVCLDMVKGACREFGVTSFVKDVNPSTYRVIAMLLQGRSGVSIADELGITTQRVGQVAERCREAGVPLPPPKRVPKTKRSR